jgi:hypothetical protein
MSRRETESRIGTSETQAGSLAEKAVVRDCEMRALMSTPDMLNVRKWRSSVVSKGMRRATCVQAVACQGVDSRTSSPPHTLMRKRAVNTSMHRPPHPAPRNRRAARAKHAYIHRRQIPLGKSNTSPMQPLVARLTLHHELVIVINYAIADAACAFAREATAIGRGRCGRASIEGVGEGVVVSVGVRCGGVHLGGGLSPALVVCFEGVLGCTF